MKFLLTFVLGILFSLNTYSQDFFKKYEGQVVYVDFWATWCSPCRGAMQQIKPLKEELNAKRVVFVYVANETSPLDIWTNLTKDIKGEHFRLHIDEWNKLTNLYKVNGIPHFLLIDKKGTVRYSEAGIRDNAWIKTEIEKLLND